MNNADLNPCIKANKHKIEKTPITWVLQYLAILAPMKIEFFSNAAMITRHADRAFFFRFNAESKAESKPHDSKASKALSKDSLILSSAISKELLLYLIG
ncbi:hypothetical protein [Aeromonas media]|uniref:hypothetical protein n=1 Tax=Aeromonas media TaxID=651 RepID=UPI00059B8509|nr:hypothetical protein [Aeromonas media]